jgi:serine/threonine protein kinase
MAPDVREKEKTSKNRKPELPTKVANGRFDLGQVLGEGCFGIVYSGIDSTTGLKVAVKCEQKAKSHGCLDLEADMLKLIHSPDYQEGFTKCLWLGREGHYTCLVMDLLGKSLEDRVEERGGKLTPKTCLIVAEQAIMRVEYLHSKGILHRDIKPENFMWGLDGRIHHLHLIDFGLAKRYWTQGKHAEMTSNNALTGTVRYASINSQKGCTQSRRDDLEAVGHMLLYCLRGSLPWSGLKCTSDADRSRKIKEKKMSTPLSELCKGFPEEFEKYLAYCRGLAFKERPDYASLRNSFRQVRKKFGGVQDHDLEWMGKDVVDQSSLQALTYAKGGFRQPDDEEKDDEDMVKPGCCFFPRFSSTSTKEKELRSMDTE